MASKSNAPLIVGIIVLTVLLFAGLAWVILRAPADQSPSIDVPLTFHDANEPSTGPATAPVTVHLYGDYQCPACRAAEATVSQIIQEYRDRIHFVWKDFPLPMHSNARPAAAAVRCAYQQGKFIEYHDKLFQDASWLDAKDPTNSFLLFAKNLSLDQNKFQACMTSQAGDQSVAADLAEGNANQVDRTPTYFINRARVFSMSPVDWRAALDKALSAASSTLSSSSSTR